MCQSLQMEVCGMLRLLWSSLSLLLVLVPGLLYGVLPLQNFSAMPVDTHIVLSWYVTSTPDLWCTVIKGSPDGFPMDPSIEGAWWTPGARGLLTFSFGISKGLESGVVYYITGWTIADDSTSSPPVFAIAPSPLPPRCKSYAPSLTMEGWFPVIDIIFDAPMDESSFEKGIRVRGERGEYKVSFNYDEWAHELKVSFDSSAVPFDTITVSLSGDLIRNALGISLDGNGNRFVDGSPEDDIVWWFATTVPGDFDVDGDIDFDDFYEYFVPMWEGEMGFVELGPATVGGVESLRISPDGVFDFEDFVTFVRCWRWMGKSRKAELSGQGDNPPFQWRWEGDTLVCSLPPSVRGLYILVDGATIVDVDFPGGALGMWDYREVMLGGNLGEVKVVFDRMPVRVSAEARGTEKWSGILVRGQLSVPSVVEDIIEIGLCVERPGVYMVDVMDISGRVREIVYKGNLLPGEYHFTAGGDLPSGVYFVRWNRGVRKVVKLR